MVTDTSSSPLPPRRRSYRLEPPLRPPGKVGSADPADWVSPQSGGGARRGWGASWRWHSAVYCAGLMGLVRMSQIVPELATAGKGSQHTSESQRRPSIAQVRQFFLSINELSLFEAPIVICSSNMCVKQDLCLAIFTYQCTYVTVTGQGISAIDTESRGYDTSNHHGWEREADNANLKIFFLTKKRRLGNVSFSKIEVPIKRFFQKLSA